MEVEKSDPDAPAVAPPPPLADFQCAARDPRQEREPEPIFVIVRHPAIVIATVDHRHGFGDGFVSIVVLQSSVIVMFDGTPLSAETNSIVTTAPA